MKNKIRCLLNVFFLMMYCGLGGCTSFYPSDISLVSVQAVERINHPEISNVAIKTINPKSGRPETYTYDEFISTLSTLKNGAPTTPKDLYGFFDDYSKSRLNQSLPKREFLKVGFESKENLRSYKVNNSFTLSNYTFFCDEQNNFLISYPTIFWNGIDLSFTLNNIPVLKNERNLITYYLFIGTENLKKSKYKEKYNLHHNPRDVCIKIGGTIMGINGFESNMIKISKEKIIQILKESPFSKGGIRRNEE